MTSHWNDNQEFQTVVPEGLVLSVKGPDGTIHSDGLTLLTPECHMGLETENAWKKTAQAIPERCDLSGLSREPTQYQLSSTGMGSKKNNTEQHISQLSQDMVAKMKEKCLEGDLTPETLVLFAVHHMLHRFGHGSDTSVAVLTHLPELTPSGSSTSSSSSRASTPPMYPRWNVVPSLVNHCNRTDESVCSALAQAATSFPWAQNSASRVVYISELIASELVDLIIVFDDFSPVPPLDFPLVLRVSLHEPLWKFTFTYSPDLFSYTIIDSLQSALCTLLAVTLHPERLFNDVELLPANQVKQLAQWNDTDGSYPSKKRLHHLIEEVVVDGGDKTAIQYGDVSVSYAALNRRANGLARHLCLLDIQPEQLVGLFLDKSDMMIVAILGIWKSGAAHVPIDPGYPNDRIRFILDDTKFQVMIASQCHLDRLRSEISDSDSNIQLLCLENLLAAVDKDLEKYPETSTNLSHLPLTSKQLAYVTYTSGTTGFPKGIYKEHTSVVNSITDLSARYGVAGSPDEVILLFSAYVFEPFVRQMLMALTTGSKLVIISDEDKFDPGTLLPLIRSRKVTYLNGTASVLQEYDFSTCPSLKRIILVGENLTPARYEALRVRFRGRILSEYGFTESAFVTALKIFEPDARRTDRSLGGPVRNVKCYILDANLKRVPIGVTGELHIGGLGISRGYMNRDSLTREKFLPNPFRTEKERQQGINKLMYKTGDLARWLPNGEVECLGRADFQIKLRGIRIEPGEIESTLATYPGVRTSIVVAKKLLTGKGETSQEHLVGYFVSERGLLAEHDLLAFLETKLPRYMIPTRLIQVPQIPVTINGKADFAALPDAHVVDVVRRKSASGRWRNEVEQGLALIWAEVLQVSEDDICLDSNFFRLGGHSIACIQLIARTRERLHRGITLEGVFSAKTLGAMSDLLLSKESSIRLTSGQEANGINDFSPLDGHMTGTRATDESQERRYLASSLQQGFVYHALKSEGSDAYIIQSTIHYGVALEDDRYRKAWNVVNRQHPSLRLRFVWGSEVSQVIDSADSVMDWRARDWTTVRSTRERKARMEQLQQEDRREGYALDKGALLRVYYICLPESQHVCLFSCHHAILDGWTLPLLFDHVHQAYLDLVDNEISRVDGPEDFTYLLAQEYLQTHRGDHVQYWQTQIQQIGERCDMNSLLNEASRYKVPLADYDKIVDQRQQTIALPWANLVARNEFKSRLDSQGITLHSVLQLVWHLVLHSYGGGSHTITGTTISGRHLPIEGIESAVGLFINTLPLIVDQSKCRGMTVMEALAHVQGLANAMNSRSNVELGRLGSHDLKHGLFDSLFVLENYPNLDTGRVHHQAKLKYTVEGGLEKLSYPLAVIAREDGDTCSFTLCYAAELFSDDTIRVLLQTISDAFTHVTANLDATISSIEFLSANERAQLDRWNATEQEYPNKTLHALFEPEADQNPEKTAVVYENTRLSYSVLNSRANALACHLLDLVPIRPNRLVALVMHKSEHLITSILAVWKTGGAYVPIDPGYPDERIQYILEDTAALAVITDAPYLSRIQAITCGQPIILADVVETLPLTSTNTNSSCTPTDLAYIMYTSGTTGKPKGVMIEHHGVVNLCASLSQIFSLRATDDEVILSFSNYVFDHFVEQMTDALLNGQTLLVLNDDMRGDKERLYSYISTNRVTYLSGTPSVLSMYEFDRFGDHLRRIDCVGEAFSEPVFDKIRDTFPGLVINGYGPTEVSITTHKRLYPFPERRTDKSIGKQVANSKTYVLSGDMKRVPIGAVGELYLGGDGVARGYHNREDLTAERFPLNPFQTEREKREGNKNSRLYKTGDLVRWVGDGEIEYLGRNDFQVKIRGQRIELGEIEAVLSSYPEITQSVVLARDRESDGQKYLVGYFVPFEGRHLSPQAIRRSMLTRLPEYMVPGKLVPVDKFPVTVSGKLDTKALPVPEDAIDEHAVSPRTDTERTLAKIWADLLEVSLASISIHSDFFGLGGDSLKSTKLSFAATQALGVPVSVKDLFSNPTIEALSTLIDKASGEIVVQALSMVDSNGDIPVSPAQERLIFLHEFDDVDKSQHQGGAFNIAMHFSLDKTVRLEALERAIRDVVSRHEALRTLIVRTGSNYIQQVLSADEAQRRWFILVQKGISRSEMEEQMIESARTNFQIGSDLPIHVRLYQTTEADTKSSNSRRVSTGSFISIVIHHLAFDGWSWPIFKRDLSYFYSTHLNSSHVAHSIPELSSQYKEYTIYHQETLLSPQRNIHSDYWLRKLTDWEPLYFATDLLRPTKVNYIGNDIQRAIPPETVNRLRQVAKREGTSLYTVCLSAYLLLLGLYTSQTDVITGIPVAHRTRADFKDVIGFFVNLLPLRVDIDQADLHQLVQAVQKEVVDAQTHQDLPFQDVTKGLGVQHDSSRHPLIQTVFNWETQSSPAEGGPSLLESEYVPSAPFPSAAKFDLNVTVAETRGSLKVNFNYATSLFERGTVEGFLGTFVGLVKRIASCSPDTPLSRLSPPVHPCPSILDRETKEDDDCVSLDFLFEQQVIANPDATAISNDASSISYKEVDARANRVAHLLTAYTKRDPGHRVALLLDKGIDMVVTILAVWKAGAAYIPLDPSYPAQRVSHILKETSPTVLVTTKSHSSQPEIMKDITVISLDSLETRITLESLPPATLSLTKTRSSTDLAYIIFTSGTTGKPKGVLIQHSSVLRFRNALLTRYWPQHMQHQQQGVLLLSNYVFDFSIEQLCLSILSGNKLVIPPEEGITHETFYALANQEHLTYLSGTPSVLQQIQLARLKHLQTVTAAGEEFHRSQFDRIRSQFKGRINNAYGITETTVYNIVTTFEGDAPFTKALCHELPGTRAYILNSHMQHVPVNAVGELYIGGECLARGYLNQEHLTKERFVPNPFFKRGGEGFESERLYKTGDMVCYRGAHRLEYLGRRDQQVKLRGFRIELSEVADALSAIPGLKDAAVVPQYSQNEDGSKSRTVRGLACYYTCEVECAQEITPETVRAHLEGNVPAYMVPSQIRLIQGSLPVTINGKIDIGRLPQLEEQLETRPSAPPRNELEIKLCKLWPSFGGKEPKCGIDDDFLACGGDSILSLRLVGEIYHATGCHVTVKDIYQQRTIRNLYDRVLSREKVVKGEGPRPAPRPKRQAVGDEAPLSPIQRWFLAKPLQNPNHWNHCFSIRTPPLSAARLEKALSLLHARHDALQMRLVSRGGAFAQRFDAKCPPPLLKTVDPSIFDDTESAVKYFDEAQSGFDLNSGPLYTVLYDQSLESSGSGRVWFAVHHMIIDTVSWSIILSDLQALYQEAKLAPITSSFQEWALALGDYKPTLEEAGHWNVLRRGVARSFETLPLPLGPVLQCEERLSREVNEALLRCTSVFSAGMHEALLMAVGVALQCVMGEGSTLVTIEGHGREDVADSSLDLSRTVGWFTSMYPFEIPRIEGLAQGVVDTRQGTRRVPRNGVGYGPVHGYGQGSLPAVSVNYLGHLGNSQVGAEGGWRLDIDETSVFPSGLCTSEPDAGKSSSMADFTFSITEGQLVISFSCSWGHGTAQKLVSTVRQSLEGLVAETSRDGFQAPSPSRGLGFTPYFTFEGGSRTGQPLFLLPPGEGGAESYFGNLVRGLPDRNLVVFNNHYREMGDINTIQGLSEYYLSHITAIQPEGPYDILGWSFGGIIGLEVAKMITDDGGRIGTLTLIDPFFDIPSAAEAIGHAGHILDPIYSSYRPSVDDFQSLPERADRIVLVKATESSEQSTDSAEGRLFEWFRASPSNNLDRYIPRDKFDTMSIQASHFSWVHCPDEVDKICSVLR